MKIKTIFITLAVMVFAFGVLTTSAWRALAQSQSANYKVGQPSSPQGNLNAVPTPTPFLVEYPLPYPGLLPDNALYPFKMVRDRVILLLTFDKIKKAERLLLYADKRLGAGKALIEGGKPDLGATTILKGEKYLEQAVAQAQVAKKAGQNTQDLFVKLNRASLKHQEILTSLLLRLADNPKKVVEDALKYSQGGYQKTK